MPGMLVLAIAVVAGALLPMAVQAQHDPTRPPPGYEESTSDGPAEIGPAPTVTAILRAADRRLALIDGTMVGIGDRVSGANVLDIQRDHVLLRMGSETIRVRVMTQDIRRRPGSGGR